MATPALISWSAPAHIHYERRPDWYWSVGIISLAIVALCFIFGQIIPGIVVIVSVSTLVLHTTKSPQSAYYEINDRGVVIDEILYPFTSLESFWIPHDITPPRLLIKSRKALMPLIIILIDEVDPEDVRNVMLTYIAETEHRELFLKHVLEWLGF